MSYNNCVNVNERELVRVDVLTPQKGAWHFHHYQVSKTEIPSHEKDQTHPLINKITQFNTFYFVNFYFAKPSKTGFGRRGNTRG